MRKALRKWIEKNFGKRCEDFEPSCCVCQAWFVHDWLFQKGMWNTHDIKIVKSKSPVVDLK
jgi:hypothetical protein